MTGFEVTADGPSEPLVVVNYAVGNYYGLHFDSLGNGHSDDEDGNRIATILIYLSNVEKGGITVFPEALSSTVPGKGSANLHSFDSTSFQTPRMTTHPFTQHAQ